MNLASAIFFIGDSLIKTIRPLVYFTVLAFQLEPTYERKIDTVVSYFCPALQVIEIVQIYSILRKMKFLLMISV